MKPALFAFTILAIAASPVAGDETMPIYEMQNATTKVLWKATPLPAKARVEISKIEGEGVITDFWLTHMPESNERNNYLGRAVVLNIYWDGSDKPAVSAPIADFFCQPIQLQAIENEFFTASNEICVFNCLIPMPFRKSARFELVNDTEKDLRYFHRLDVEFRELSENALYLHAYWRRQSKVDSKQSLTVLPKVMGEGRYLGTHWAVHQAKPQKDWPWYLRSAQFYLDGQAEPAIDVPTMDDYIDSGWWENEVERKPYAHRYAGRPFVRGDGSERLSVVFYRYHVRNPVWFHREMSFTVSEQVFKTSPAPSDWSSTAFFYLNRPSNDLPEIQDIEIRTLDQ